MKKENKELLLRDLCARLPYGVKINNEIQGNFVIYGVCENCIFAGTITEPGLANHIDFHIENIKPYLFPLSSMTEEQKREYYSLKHEVPVCHYEYGDVVEEFELYDSPESFEYLIENHFDYWGLIEKGLAIDATGLNIY